MRPFLCAGEFAEWTDDNCDTCAKRQECTAAKALQTAMAAWCGEIDDKAVALIGSNGGELVARCKGWEE